MDLYEASHIMPRIVCPFCDWNIGYFEVKRLTQYKEHLRTSKCYRTGESKK